MPVLLKALRPLQPILHRLPARHYRSDFVNSYPQVHAGDRRLDFTYYEFDLPRFEEVVNGLVALTLDFKRRTGFQPGGFAMYFVRRSGNKPLGNYSWPAGESSVTLLQRAHFPHGETFHWSRLPKRHLSPVAPVCYLG